ncbi:asparagine synthase (glutamine-hydrolyzing) [Rhodoferax ferrireducens]|uniref:asparagine synthase (glutamine-hydrolyzing) n=1 Tax=Rhodoferax ferrireducens TaxID=192843 RepID=A0ABU2CFP1_9BURK|nr:asparagine synthase-related protein [Rhodoferax ferrireducens]MDR7380145.1 asparagine synthase (glutamine-hydrolyzing) [Rhodoferax ferrireducens]
MSLTSPSLALGSPRFADARLAELARTDGAIAAWQAACAQDAAKAALQATGDFAVGLQQPSGRTFLAVDRFAIRSLCYRVVDGQLRFAERADALAQGPDGAEIDPQAIFDYLYFHAIPSPRTIFKGVFRLPPGHYALFDNGQLTVAPYWVPTFAEQGNVSFDALRDEFRGLVRNAVAAQLDGGKAACFLSGGTDSSTVAGMLSDISGKSGEKAATYSIGFDAEGYDEMEYARLAARHFKTEHHEYYVTPDDLVRSIANVASSYDQPFGNSSALPSYYCSRVAKDDGVTKILAGDGGDELFGGNARYAKQRVFGWYGVVPSALRSGLMEPLLDKSADSSIALLRKASSYVEQAKVPMPDRLQMYNLLLRLGVNDVLTPDFLAQVDIQGPAVQQRSVWSQAKADSQVNRMLAFDWRYTLAESDLPKVCGTTRLAGLGVGFPMLNEALLEFSLKLPTEYKLKGLKLRWFFKEALRGFLPDEILTKKKQGFGLPFGVWATRHDGLKQVATDALNSLATRNIVRPEFIHSLLGERLQEHPGYYGEMVWILMMLEQWLQTHAPQFKLEK